MNAKMSGRGTYIDIMDACELLLCCELASASLDDYFTGFGAKGRAAVSFFQFAFAFGVSLNSSMACNLLPTNIT